MIIYHKLAELLLHLFELSSFTVDVQIPLSAHADDLHQLLHKPFLVLAQVAHPIVGPIFVEPDFGVAFWGEPDHVGVDLERTGFVVQMIVTLEGSIEDVERFWVGQLRSVG